VPSRLRPTAPLAEDAILVGDPGRALLLAQELLIEPKMSNHARGLWGYSGTTGEGRPLTIQATGMGGPSAALVLGDLAKLGVRRALRIGTCLCFDDAVELGALLTVSSALAVGGSAIVHGAEPAEDLRPDPGLTERLEAALGDEGRPATVASFDAYPAHPPPATDAVVADLQTASLLARARELEVRLAALLIVTESTVGNRLDKELLEERERRAGRAAATTLSG
jgi:purine-nucleoside phosphorylase